MLRNKKVVSGKLLMLFVFLLPVLSWAQEEAVTLESLKKSIGENKMIMDTMWTLLAGVLVFFMHCGFAMLEAGFTRAKNVVNILMKNYLNVAISSIAFWAIGFAIMFGAGTKFFGTSGFFLHGDEKTFSSLDWTTVPLAVKYFFQMVFCATGATIVSGAMAERTKLLSFLAYSFVITAVIYPVVGHWIWGGGWLADLGMWDFAGSTVVHSTGAWLALVGAKLLGPRMGKYGPDGQPRAIPGHSIPLAALGTFILWLGWFGFNPGSTMAADPSIGHIAVTTNLAAAAGALVAIFVSKWTSGSYDGSMALNGGLAGLVAITAPCAFVGMKDAVIIGAVAGAIVVFAVNFVDKVLKVDDPVGAISVHGACGIWGTLAVGIFAQKQIGGTPNGLLYGGGLSLLGAQLAGVLAVGVWCLVAGFASLSVIKAFLGLRVSEIEELRGLDIDEHGMEGYAGFQIFMTEAGALAPASERNQKAATVSGGAS